jgi:hypothetical protein
MAQLQPSSTEPGAIYLCNVPVSQRVQNLRKRIESRLGNIQCLVVPGLRHNGAVALMGYVDGRPTIKLDQGVGATESEVCHELLHFELDIRGWPKEPPPFPAGMSHDAAHSITRAYLWSELQHRVVDDEAHKLGMTPDASYRSELLGTVQSGNPFRLFGEFFPNGPQSHTREIARPIRRLLWKFPNSSVKPATLMLFLWRRPSTISFRATRSQKNRQQRRFNIA